MITKPSENDILLGRGGKNNKNEGNEKLRILCRKNASKYAKSSKTEKALIIDSLLGKVFGPESLTRFLFKNKDSGHWEVAGRSTAREKVSQALRDAVYEHEKEEVDVVATLAVPEEHQSFSQSVIYTEHSKDEKCHRRLRGSKTRNMETYQFSRGTDGNYDDEQRSHEYHENYTHERKSYDLGSSSRHPQQWSPCNVDHYTSPDTQYSNDLPDRVTSSATTTTTTTTTTSTTSSNGPITNQYHQKNFYRGSNEIGHQTYFPEYYAGNTYSSNNDISSRISLQNADPGIWSSGSHIGRVRSDISHENDHDKAVSFSPISSKSSKKTPKRHSPYSLAGNNWHGACYPEKRRKNNSSTYYGYELTSTAMPSQVHSSTCSGILKEKSNSSSFHGKKAIYNTDSEYRTSTDIFDNGCTTTSYGSSKDCLTDSTEEMESDDDSFVGFLKEIFD